MNALLEVGLSNAAATAVLAPAAALMGWCFRRRPAIVHALWVLVLLKLVTPSLVRIELPPSTAASDARPPTVVLLAAELPPTDYITPPAPPVEEVHAEAPAASPLSWRPVVIFLWLGGAVGWWGLALARVLRFPRLLRVGLTDPELRNRVARIAERFGLRQVPDALLVPACISPMVWSPGRTARLLFPADLWDELTVDQRDAVLAHELAHLRRGDPWVRRLELLVDGLYWWHPAVWWARREIEAAEEQCCDAWVAWALPESAEAYATALISTVTYLSGRRPPLPAGASGVGHVRTLKWRLAMIMNGTPTGAAARALPRTVLLVGAVALFWLPTWAQGDPQGKSRGAAPKVERLPTPVAKASTPAGDVPAPQTVPPKPESGITATGRVYAARYVQLSPAVSGRIANTHVDVGATVKKGDVLIELDAERAKLELERARARVQPLAEKFQMLAQAAKVNAAASTEAKAAEMEFRVAQADLQLSELAFQGTRIVAPMDGTITNWNVQEGQHVAVGQSLGAVADLRRVITMVSLPPWDVNQLAVGRRCQIKLESLGETYQGAVSRIDPTINQSGTISVYVTIDPPEKGDLPRVGSSVHITFAGKSPPPN